VVHFVLRTFVAISLAAGAVCAAVACEPILCDVAASAPAPDVGYLSSLYRDVLGRAPEGPVLTPLEPDAAGKSPLSIDRHLANAAWDPAYDSGDQYAVCDDCPKRSVIAFVSYDSWRGHPDGSWQHNGISSGLNFGTRLGRFSDLTGIGFQIGGSAAAYDWAGTDYRTRNQDQAQPQGFLTYGLFRRANDGSPWSAAVVQDWMFNSNYGEFAQNPTLSQWRGQAGYALGAFNEVGLWGTWRARGDTRDVPGFGSVSWRPINQLNVYARHKWGIAGPETALWLGVPEHDRLAGGGSLGDWIVGLLGNFPLSDRLAVYSLVTYMHQSASAGGIAATEDAWNFTVGLSFYPAANARWNTVAGQCWTPMLPVANNGYFLVDTNRIF